MGDVRKRERPAALFPSPTMIVFLLLFNLPSCLSSNTMPEICFADGSCVFMQNYSANAADRVLFTQQCANVAGNHCQNYYAVVEKLFGKVANAPDLAAVSAYTDCDMCFGANAQLRQQQGTNIDVQFKNLLEMTSSGLNALLDHAKYSFDGLVYRYEPDYPSARCQFGNGQPSFEPLNQTDIFWAYTSTTTATSRLHGPRILLLFQRPSGNYRAGSYLYPLGYVEQQEVTLPGGTRWHSIACERVNLPRLGNVALLYAYDVTTLPLLSDAQEQSLLTRMRAEFKQGMGLCWPLVCATECTFGNRPQLCSCNGSAARVDPNVPIVGTCQLTRGIDPQVFQIRLGISHFGYCLVDVNQTLALDNYVGLGECSTSPPALAAASRWFVDPQSNIVHINDRNGACLGFGASGYLSLSNCNSNSLALKPTGSRQKIASGVGCIALPAFITSGVLLTNDCKFWSYFTLQAASGNPTYDFK